MKRLFFVLLAVLLMGGVCFAQNQMIDPTTSVAQDRTSVYNNSGGDLDIGDVVVWDIDASTGNNDAYITTTTTADTHLVAGIVYPDAIATGQVGSILTFGVGTCDTLYGAAPAENGDLCTSTTAGAGSNCSTSGANQYGFCTAVAASNSCTCFVNVR